MRIWPTCNKLGVQFCDNILKPLESLAFFHAGLVGKRPKIAGIWKYQRFRYELIKVAWTKMKFDQDDHVGMIELQHEENYSTQREMYFSVEIGELNLSPVFSVVLKQSICRCHQATTTRRSLKQRKLASMEHH